MASCMRKTRLAKFYATSLSVEQRITIDKQRTSLRVEVSQSVLHPLLVKSLLEVLSRVSTCKYKKVK